MIKEENVYDLLFALPFTRKLQNLHWAGLLTCSGSTAFPFVCAANSGLCGGAYCGTYSYGDSSGISPDSLLIHLLFKHGTKCGYKSRVIL